MNSLERGVVRDVLFLSLAAGAADAAGYMGLGRVFTSNMTGNVVLLGIDLGQGHFASAAHVVYVLLVFVLGVGLGAQLGKGVREKDWPHLASRLVRLEKFALVLFALGWLARADSANSPLSYPLVAVLALAMGLQSAAMNRLSAPGVATTAITGTLTALVTGLVTVAVGGGTVEEKNSWNRIKFQSGVVGLYCCGAAVCGLLIMHLPRLAGCLPALAVLFVSPERKGK